MGLFSSNPPPVRIPAQPGDWILIEHPYLPGNYEEVQCFSFYPVIAWRRDDDLARYYPESLDDAQLFNAMGNIVEGKPPETYYIRGGLLWYSDATLGGQLSVWLMDRARGGSVLSIFDIPMELRNIIIPAIDRSMKNMVAGHHYPMLY